jgi:hypothetical protein
MSLTVKEFGRFGRSFWTKLRTSKPGVIQTNDDIHMEFGDSLALVWSHLQPFAWIYECLERLQGIR